MKNFKVLKVLIILLLLIGTVLIGVSNAQEAIPSTEKGPTVAISEKTTNIATNVAGVLQTVGITLAVISMLVLGIKYMIGSVEEKAQYKKSMILYLAGAIFLTLTGSILKLISGFTNDALK